MRLMAGASVAAGLVGALVVSLLVGQSTVSNLPTSTTGESEPLVSLTAEVTVFGTGSFPTTVPSDPTGDVQEAGAAALTAWGRFAVSGDLAILSDHFHGDSPQSSLLAEKAADLAVDPLGEPPYHLAMANPTIEHPSPGMATMKGPVTATRGEEASSVFDWRLVLVWSDESRSWLVWTLEETG